MNKNLSVITLLLLVLTLSLFLIGCKSSSPNNELYDLVESMGYTPYTPPRSGYGATSIVHFKDNKNNSLNMELVCKNPFEGISISNDFLSVESSKSQFTQEIGQSIEFTKAIKKIELTENAEYRSSQNITLNVNTLKSEHFAWEEMAEPNGAVKQFTPQCNFAINSYLDKGSEINLFILIDVISSDDIHISSENVGKRIANGT